MPQIGNLTLARPGWFSVDRLLVGHLDATLLLAFAFLIAAVTAVPVFKRLGLGSVLGYLAAGLALGPYGLAIGADSPQLLHLAEFGVVILLFLIGLELRPHKLWSMRRAVFGLGSLQVLLTAAALGGVAFLLLGQWEQALLIGLALALSSTAFALQFLAEKGELGTEYGRKSFAILLFQDIAAIPILALIPVLARPDFQFSSSTATHLGVVLAAISALIVLSRTLLRKGLRLVATAQTREIFTAAALAVVVGVGLLMQSLSLSMALGAFLAGLLLSDSEYRHQLEADMEPFKGLLLGLFFMAIGLSLDLSLAAERPWVTFGCLVGLVTIKTVIAFGLGRAFGLSSTGAASMGALLSQGGEFGFVIFAAAAQQNLLGKGIADFLILIVTLSMPLSALVSLAWQRGASRWTQLKAKAPTFDSISEHQPVIIAGFGRVGQMTGRILRVLGQGFTALELDPDQIAVVRRFGNPIYYGDAARLDLLRSAGAEKARVFVLAVDDAESSVEIAKAVRETFPHLKIVARARNRAHYFQLRELGVDSIYRETFSSSLEMASDVLQNLGLEPARIESVLQVFRESDERLLAQQFDVRGDEQSMIRVSRESSSQLMEVLSRDLSSVAETRRDHERQTSDRA